MSRFKVPEQGKDPEGNEGEIRVFDGDQYKSYPVHDGEIEVDDAHDSFIQRSVPSAQKVEAPPTATPAPETPA